MSKVLIVLLTAGSFSVFAQTQAKSKPLPLKDFQYFHCSGTYEHGGETFLSEVYALQPEKDHDHKLTGKYVASLASWQSVLAPPTGIIIWTGLEPMVSPHGNYWFKGGQVNLPDQVPPESRLHIREIRGKYQVKNIPSESIWIDCVAYPLTDSDRAANPALTE